MQYAAQLHQIQSIYIVGRWDGMECSGFAGIRYVTYLPRYILCSRMEMESKVLFSHVPRTFLSFLTFITDILEAMATSHSHFHLPPMTPMARHGPAQMAVLVLHSPPSEFLPLAGEAHSIRSYLRSSMVVLRANNNVASRQPPSSLRVSPYACFIFSNAPRS